MRGSISQRWVGGVSLLLVSSFCQFALGHPFYGTDCTQCHFGVSAAMSTTPASGSTLTFGKILLGRSSTASFTVTNTSTTQPGFPPNNGGGGFSGSFPAASAPFSPTSSQTITATPPSGGTAPYTFVLPPAIVAVDGGQSSVSQVYTFTPTTRGASSQTVTFTPSAGFLGTTPSSTITLSGTGVAPVISLNSSAGSVGNVRIGTTGTASLKINNIGDGNQAGTGLGNLTGTVAAGSGGFTGSGGSFNLADNGSQTFNFTVSPTAHGAVSTNIAVNASDGNSNGTNSAQSLSAALSAVGVGPTLSTSLAAGSALNFGSPQAPADTLTVANATTDANLGALTNLDIISASLSGSGASMFSLSGITPGTILTKSQSANLEISFTPGAGASGTETATLTLVTDEGAANGAAGKTVSFSLAGTAALTSVYWKGGHSGAWNATSPGYNWVVASGSTTEVSALPNASTDVFFADSSPGTTNTTLGQDMTVKSVNFASTSAPITIGGSHTLTVANGITVSGGTAGQTITAPVQLTATQTWAVNSSSPLTVSGAISGSGAALVKSGSGQLVLSGVNTYSGGTSVTAGSLQVAAASALPTGMSVSVAGSGSAIVLSNSMTTAVKVGALNLDGGSSTPQAKIDLGTGELIVDMSQTPLATIRNQILAGAASGAWTGNGITSSAAAADARAGGGKGNTALGYADNADPGMGLTTFGGQPVNANSVLIRYTLLGDANLDGTVNLADFLALRRSFGTTSSANWDQGDFDYDGKVDLNDFLILRAHFGQSLPGSIMPLASQVSSLTSSVPPPASPLVVPEPSTGTLLMVAFVLVFGGFLSRMQTARKLTYY
jgi:fibronectin-binding autotransporter adhesin